MAKRYDFNGHTPFIIARNAAYICSNPDCYRLTDATPYDGEKSHKFGEAAHIHAASSEGPRFDKNLTPDQIRDSSNGIWLCKTCHVMVDQQPQIYTAITLREWKADLTQILQSYHGKKMPLVPLGDEKIKRFSGVSCPYCGTNTTIEGQSVCTGCHARIKYGVLAEDFVDVKRNSILNGLLSASFIFSICIAIFEQPEEGSLFTSVLIGFLVGISYNFWKSTKIHFENEDKIRFLMKQ